MASTSSDLRLRLTADQRRAIDQLAALERTSPEEAILRAVERALAADRQLSAFPAGTPFHGVDHVLGDLGDAPPDLSTNRAYLDDLGT